ncbi:response regulator transcription factor [Cohnella soli]|uniref:Response regulator n=1 Tax=Cohnella soli TaxID=425005 RepID=A0ABW0I0K8_9BACL
MYKVLMVDDEAFILDGLKIIVDWAEYGFEITGWASNGARALELLEQNEYHLLITDIRMPHMNGIELIRAIRSRHMNVKIVVLSGFSDFEYVKEASRLGIENYLLKPVNEDELASTLLNLAEKIEGELFHRMQQRVDYHILRDNILYRWAAGNIDGKELKERALLLNLNLEASYYRTCILRVTESREGFHNELHRGHMNDLGAFALCNIVSETLGPRDDLYVFPTVNGEAVLIFLYNEMPTDNSDLLIGLRGCLTNVNVYLRLNAYITVGPVVRGFRSLGNSYQSALELFDYRLVLPPNTVIDYDMAHESSELIPESLHTSLLSLKTSIVSADREAADQLIDELFKQLRSFNSLTPTTIRGLTVELLSAVFGASQVKVDRYHQPFAYPEAFYSKTFEVTSIPELIALVKEAAEQAIQVRKAMTEKQNPTVERIANYVKEHYSEDLSLKILADKYNLNAAYLGQLFKSETGQMFTHYLNDIRIEKAKQLFANTKLNAAEVAEKVGYVNAKYFYSLFKKLTGVYPSDYKRSFQPQ